MWTIILSNPCIKTGILGVFFIIFAGTVEADAISIEFTYNENVSVLKKTPMFTIQVTNISSLPIKILNLDSYITWTHSFINFKSLECPAGWGFGLFVVRPSTLEEEHYILLQPDDKIIFDQVGSPARSRDVCLGRSIAQLTFRYWLYPPDYKKEMLLETKEFFIVTPDVLRSSRLKYYNKPWVYRYFQPRSDFDDNRFQDMVNLARQGDSINQQKIGTMYRIGEKVERNILLAYAWYTIAERNQIKENDPDPEPEFYYPDRYSPDAGTLKESMALSMTEEEIEKANKIAEEFINKYPGILIK